MKIVECQNQANIIVEFQDKHKHKKQCSYYSFLKGQVSNPFAKTVYNVGYIGSDIKISHKGKVLKSYIMWNSMLKRCYRDNYEMQSRTYKNCFVSTEWLNYTAFLHWYNKNYYEIPEELMCLDKDILVKGNKMYSPDYCCIVPQTINNLFTKSDAIRGDCPIGVCWHERDNIYEAWCDDGNGKQTYLGRTDNKIEAFYMYKRYKEDVIKKIANKYKEYLPSNIYIALLNYEVCFDD